MNVSKYCFEVIGAEMSEEDVKKLFIDKQLGGCVSPQEVEILGTKVKLDIKVINPLMAKNTIEKELEDYKHDRDGRN